LFVHHTFARVCVLDYRGLLQFRAACGCALPVCALRYRLPPVLRYTFGFARRTVGWVYRTHTRYTLRLVTRLPRSRLHLHYTPFPVTLHTTCGRFALLPVTFALRGLVRGLDRFHRSHCYRFCARVRATTLYGLFGYICFAFLYCLVPFTLYLPTLRFWTFPLPILRCLLPRSLRAVARSCVSVAVPHYRLPATFYGCCCSLPVRCVRLNLQFWCYYHYLRVCCAFALPHAVVLVQCALLRTLPVHTRTFGLRFVCVLDYHVHRWFPHPTFGARLVCVLFACLYPVLVLRLRIRCYVTFRVYSFSPAVLRSDSFPFGPVGYTLRVYVYTVALFTFGFRLRTRLHVVAFAFAVRCYTLAVYRLSLVVVLFCAFARYGYVCRFADIYGYDLFTFYGLFTGCCTIHSTRCHVLRCRYALPVSLRLRTLRYVYRVLRCLPVCVCCRCWLPLPVTTFTLAGYVYAPTLICITFARPLPRLRARFTRSRFWFTGFVLPV